MEKLKKRLCDRIVYDVMKEICPKRTSEIATACLSLKIGVASSTKFARELRTRGCVKSYRAEDDDSEITYEVIGEFISRAEYKSWMAGKLVTATPAVGQVEMPGMME